MSELEQILAAVANARARGVGGVLATVVRVSGSTYRRPGARMWIADDGATVGAISGGCLERELRRRAAWLASDGPTVVRFDTTSEDEVVWEFGLGCRGVVHVLLERIESGNPPPYLAKLAQWTRERRGGVAAVVIEADSGSELKLGQRVTLNSTADLTESPAPDQTLARLARSVTEAALAEQCSRNAAIESAAGRALVFVEYVEPAAHLLIFGGNHDVQPLAQAAAALGWRVDIVTSRNEPALQSLSNVARITCCKPGLAGEQVAIDERSLAVVMSHNFFDDLANLRFLLAGPAAFIGVLGPRSRTVELLEALAVEGPALTPEQQARVHAPVGLDIGAETPAEIALSILAQLQAARRARCAAALCERGGPIHAPLGAAVAAPPPPDRPQVATRVLQCPLT